MSFLERLFGFGSNKQTAQPDVVFGRYSDAYKSDEQLAAFDRSLELFEKEEYLNAYREFLSSLKDPNQDHIQWREEADTIHFEFWQGSQHITGTAGLEKVKVQSTIAKAEDLHIGVLRRLVAANFNLKFSRFALSPDNCLVILFDTGTADGSPLKLMYALRELAIHADKQDDLLLDEFQSLQPVTERVFGDISEAEKTIKYQYIQSEITRVFGEIDKGKPDPNQYPGSYAYLLLALAFKLDYLIRPEGFMMDVLEKIHGIYFAKNEKTPQVKIAQIRKEYQKLLDRSQADFFKEMYRTRSTFGVNPAVNQGSVAALIEGELPNMEWPLQQNHDVLALAVPQYIAGFAMFHYAPPKPARDLFHLFFKVTEPEFFKNLGFTEVYTDVQGRLDKRAIQLAIKSISDQNRTLYPNFKPDLLQLDFASVTLFAKSYLAMIKDLNLTKAE
ncbi:MAG: hypothetical protein WCR52_21200 [Bacteroidota bacterium]